MFRFPLGCGECSLSIRCGPGVQLALTHPIRDARTRSGVSVEGCERSQSRARFSRFTLGLNATHAMSKSCWL